MVNWSRSPTDLYHLPNRYTQGPGLLNRSMVGPADPLSFAFGLIYIYFVLRFNHPLNHAGLMNCLC